MFSSRSIPFKQRERSRGCLGVEMLPGHEIAVEKEELENGNLETLRGY